MTSPVSVQLSASRRNDKLFVPRGASLPPRCIKCGVTATRAWRRKFSWHHPAVYLVLIFAFLGVIIYAIVAALVRKQIELNVPLCDVHDSDRKRYKALAVVMLLGFVPAGAMMGLASERFGWVTGVAMLVVGLVFALKMSLGFIPAKIDEFGGLFKGAGSEFLQFVPQDQSVQFN